MLNYLSFEGSSEANLGENLRKKNRKPERNLTRCVFYVSMHEQSIKKSMIMVAKETNLSIPTFVWYWLKTTMKSTLFLLLFFGSIHCNVENKISKVICSLCPSKDVDFLKGSLANPVKLSKDLFKECNIRFRIVSSDVSDFGKKNILSFATLDNENKETLWPFQTIFS